MSNVNKVEIFEFDKEKISNILFYQEKLDKKFKIAFEYILSKLPIQKIHSSFSENIWENEKNYNWLIVEKDNIFLIIRQYRTHFTIFSKNTVIEKYDNIKYSCFSIFSDFEKMNDDTNDKYVYNNFIDLDNLIDNILILIKEKNIHTIWNNSVLKRPDFCEIKNIWNGERYHISNIEEFIFCCEELFRKYLHLYAENDMIQHIKKYKVGDMISTYRIIRIRNKDEDDEDSTFYQYGIEWVNTNFSDSKPSFRDVYSLTRYYFNDLNIE